MQFSPTTCAADIALKTISRVIPTAPSHWVGDGFYVKPVFNQLAFTKEISPFLMFDYAAPKEFEASSKRRGVGVHPHRGFETVTIAFQGEVEHGDSLGNRDVIGPGDVQWMTAGRGIVHEEFLSEKFSKTGGTLEMAQLWVNLPKQHKMTAPKYQPIIQDNIPEVTLDGGSGKVRVIAGSFDGVSGAASTWSPINMWDVSIQPSKNFDFILTEGHTTLIFVREGAATLLESLMKPQSVALLTKSGSRVRVEAGGTSPAKILVLSGEPIEEPIAARGVSGLIVDVSFCK